MASAAVAAGAGAAPAARRASAAAAAAAASAAPVVRPVPSVPSLRDPMVSINTAAAHDALGPRRGQTLYDVARRELGRINHAALRATVNRRAALHLAPSTTRTIAPHTQAAITCLDVDRTERRYLLCGAQNGALRLFDTRPHTAAAVRAHTCHATPLNGTDWGMADGAPVSSVQWFPHDTGLFVVGSMGGSGGAGVRVYDTNALAVATEFRLDSGPVYGAALSPVSGGATHSLIAAASRSAHIRLCDMSTGAFSHTLIGHVSGTDVWCVSWSPVNPYELVSGGTDGTCRLWDIRRSGAMHHRVLDQFHTSAAVSAAAAAAAGSGGSAAAGAGGGGAKRLSSGGSGRSASGNSVGSAASSGSGGGGSTAGALSHSGGVTHAVWSRDGRWLYTSGSDGRLRKWDMYGAGAGAAAAGSSSHSTGGSSGGGLSARGPTNTLVNFAATQNTQRVNRFCLTGDDAFLCYPSGGTRVRLYDVVSGACVREYGSNSAVGGAHRERVLCAAYHPPGCADEQTLYTGGADARVVVWTPTHASRTAVAAVAPGAAGAAAAAMAADRRGSTDDEPDANKAAASALFPVEAASYNGAAAAAGRMDGFGGAAAFVAAARGDDVDDAARERVGHKRKHH